MNEIIELVEALGDYTHDPLKFVYFAFPWGEPGPLEKMNGPEEWQKDILKDIRDGVKIKDNVVREAVASGHGIGKLHRLNSICYTPEGMKRWGDLKPGNYVFGANGEPVKILQTHYYENVPMYRVTFDDRSHVDVSSGHLWNVRGRQERRKHIKGWRTLSTLDILKMGVKRPNGKSKARQWEIPIQGAAKFKERDIPIHPYLMGLWIGDGSRNTPGYTKPCPELIEKLQNIGYKAKFKKDGEAVRIYNNAALFKEGVFNCHSYERYIPDDYKYNTVKRRKQLLCGLLDTDGEINKNGSIIYSTTSRQLADDVLWLVRSLGGKAAMQPTVKQGWYRDKDGNKKICRKCYRTTIVLSFNPFTVRHKKERYHPSVQERYKKRWIESIEPAGYDDGMCITVDSPDGLYLTEHFIVTHNSTLVAWLILWAISTHENTRGVVTANTETQLRTKTWPELIKWYNLFIGRPLFTATATAIFANEPGKEKNWRIDAIPWSDNNTEAFAGLHNQGNRILLLFDEASAISNQIWEVAEGAMTDKDTEIIWCAFGNPTRNTGRFYDCFHKFRSLWNQKQVDSRSVSFSNKGLIRQWINTWGEDSDFVRIRVKGQFPNASSLQLISTELAEKARGRNLKTEQFNFAPVIIGVDPAWMGDDATAIWLRQGLMAKRLKKIQKNNNDIAVANLIARYQDEYKADAVNIDMGYGTGIYSAGETMGRHWNLIPFSGESPDMACKNMRAYMWDQMRKWLANGGAYPDDQQMQDDLTGVEIKPTEDGKLQLQSKEYMKQKGIPSPNDADALALTFAVPVIRAPNKKRVNTKYQLFT